jgi:AcrR family transcriptional regulator
VESEIVREMETVMGILERKTRHKESLRQDILDAAREMFVRDGYEGVSMRKIAERIEYSPTTIYHYFDDKAQLLSEIVHETFLKFNARMAAHACQTRADALDCLLGGMQIYVDFALQNPSHYYVTFMMEAPADCPEHLKPQVHEQGMRAFDYLRQAVIRAMAEGRLAAGDAELAAQTIWCGIHGVASLLINAEGHFPFVEREVLVASTLRTLLVGLGADAEAVERLQHGRTQALA